MATLKEINELKAKHAAELEKKMSELDLGAETTLLKTQLGAAVETFKSLILHVKPADIRREVKSLLKSFADDDETGLTKSTRTPFDEAATVAWAGKKPFSAQDVSNHFGMGYQTAMKGLKASKKFTSKQEGKKFIFTAK